MRQPPCIAYAFVFLQSTSRFQWPQVQDKIFLLFDDYELILCWFKRITSSNSTQCNLSRSLKKIDLVLELTWSQLLLRHFPSSYTMTASRNAVIIYKTWMVVTGYSLNITKLAIFLRGKLLMEAIRNSLRWRTTWNKVNIAPLAIVGFLFKTLWRALQECLMISSKLWSSQLWTQFKQLRIKAWKS